MHDIQTIETLLPQVAQERRDLFSYEPGMAGSHLSALYVLGFQPDAQSVDSSKSYHGIVEAVVDHADHGNLVV
jgi:hypothetical protein